MLTDFQELWPTTRKSALPKSNELQSINVVKTCEKLRLALTRSCNGLQRTKDISHRRTGEELSFRSISHLCYTTLRIHEVQVNDLLNKSKELVTQSKDWSTVRAKKRNQPTNYSSTYCAKRKSRATVEHSAQDVTITNYTKLLDETAKFVEWGKTAEIVNKKVLKTNSHSRTTCIHIREITINEIDTHPEHYSNDEDDGFGNTTGDELATIIQLFADEPPKAPKRKAAEIFGVCEKKLKDSDVQEVDAIPEIGTTRSADVENVTSSLVVIPAVKNSCDNSNISELSPARKEISVMYATDCSVASENNDNYVRVPKRLNLDKLIYAPNAADKLSNNYRKKSAASNESLNKSKSNHNKTIIDASTGLTQSEMRAQLQTQINIRANLRKIRAKVKWNSGKNFTGGKHYEKLLPSANELLSTLHHNCIAFRKFKLKYKARRSNLETSTASISYNNLLREILNCKITDDLATQIYKNWNNTEKRNLKSIKNLTKYRSSEKAQILQDDIRYNESSLLPNNTMEFEVFNNNNNLQRTIRNCSPPNEQHEWGAYDVMIKLLNMWRSQIILDDEIPVELLFPQTRMRRKAAAKGFGALLRLAANGFIMLFTAENTKHLQWIKLGAASNKLIQRSELNNEIVSRRSNNGFRKISITC